LGQAEGSVPCDSPVLLTACVMPALVPVSSPRACAVPPMGRLRRQNGGAARREESRGWEVPPRARQRVTARARPSPAGLALAWTLGAWTLGAWADGGGSEAGVPAAAPGALGDEGGGLVERLLERSAANKATNDALRCYEGVYAQLGRQVGADLDASSASGVPRAGRLTESQVTDLQRTGRCPYSIRLGDVTPLRDSLSDAGKVPAKR